MKFNHQDDSAIRPPCRSRRSVAGGFTLAEVLAAMVFMAIVIPVALEGLSIASRAGEASVRRSEAALVADRILNENIVTTNWDRSVQSGVIRQGLRDFRWSLRSEPWNQDPNISWIRLLSVEVSYSLRGSEHQVRITTLVENPSVVINTNTSN